MQMLIIKSKHDPPGHTLLETLLVLFIISSLFIFPFVSISSWQTRLAAYHFFDQFERRIYATQKAAIVNQENTTIAYDNKQAQIIFTVPQQMSSWTILKIPKEIEVRRAPTLIFAAKTGNESSLNAYQFYWKEEKQLISYQFQMGSGHYLKKVE